MKKFIIPFLTFLFISSAAFAKDSVVFNFPNEGWHKVDSPDNVLTKKCFVPVNQTAQNYTEMVIFTQKILKNKDISPMAILQKQLGKDKSNYMDIVPEYINQDFDDSMVTWCSKIKNTCAIERAFQGNEGVILVIYLNKMPHYSQNMFGQWSNILSKVKLYNPDDSSQSPQNLIEL